MSLYLAVETATDLGSVALGSPGKASIEIRFGERRHGALLQPAVEGVLRLAGAGYGDLTGIVVADGPGSFTGLRIGAATALGLARARPGVALWVVPSLLGAAWNARRYAAGPVAALYDALRGEVFAAVYEFVGDGAHGVLPPVRGTLREVSRRCPRTPAVAVGDGAVRYAEEVRGWTGSEPVPPPSGASSAAALIDLLGVEGAARRVAHDAFEPAYGRLAEAQVRWEERHGRPIPDPRAARE